MAEFVYNNTKNASTGHTPFKLNCGYYLHVLFEKNVDPWSRWMLADELLSELWKLISIYHKNLLHPQEFQKQTYNKDIKPKSYALGNKIWLNNKYIKTKQNWKLEAKFFGPFQVLNSMKKQVYKLELPKK